MPLKMRVYLENVGDTSAARRLRLGAIPAPDKIQTLRSENLERRSQYEEATFCIPAWTDRRELDR